MAFNSLQFRHEAINPLQKAITSPAYYEVYFNAPPICLRPNSGGASSILDDIIQLGSNILFGDSNSIRFRVKGVDLPQRQLETQPRFTNGPQRLVPYGLVYSTMNLEIIESDRYKIRRFFELWHDSIYSNQNSYQVQYYNELVADKLTVVSYTASGLPVRVWEMKEAYPIAINSSQMSWDSIDQYLIVNIEMAFHEWTSFEATGTQYAGAAVSAISGLITDKINDKFSDKFGDIADAIFR